MYQVPGKSIMEGRRTQPYESIRGRTLSYVQAGSSLSPRNSASNVHAVFERLITLKFWTRVFFAPAKTLTDGGGGVLLIFRQEFVFLQYFGIFGLLIVGDATLPADKKKTT